MLGRLVVTLGEAEQADLGRLAQVEAHGADQVPTFSMKSRSTVLELVSAAPSRTLTASRSHPDRQDLDHLVADAHRVAARRGFAQADRPVASFLDGEHRLGARLPLHAPNTWIKDAPTLDSAPIAAATTSFASRTRSTRRASRSLFLHHLHILLVDHEHDEGAARRRRPSAPSPGRRRHGSDQPAAHARRWTR